MLGTKISNLRNLFCETKHLKTFVRIHACVTQFLKIHAISSTTTGIQLQLYYACVQLQEITIIMSIHHKMFDK